MGAFADGIEFRQPIVLSREREKLPQLQTAVPDFGSVKFFRQRNADCFAFFALYMRYAFAP